MITEYFKIGNNILQNQEYFRRAGEIIRSGGLVAFPTETVYGLGANALDSDAAKKIYEAKGRPSDNPLIIHIAKVEDADKYCYTNDLYHILAQKFMPGPLTVILPKRDCIPYTVTGGLDTVAVRLPADQNARALIEAAGVPIAAPSANRSGKPSPTTAKHVLEDMNGRIDMIIDGGESDIGLESTIVKPEDGYLNLLRPGGITLEMLEEISPVKIDKAITQKLNKNERPLAPGMKYRHYAPDTKVVLIDSDLNSFIKFITEQSKNRNIAVIVSNTDAEELKKTNAAVLTYGDDDATEAHNLFARLREVDERKCEIAYARLPEKSGIGLAVYNRIIKAAGYEVIKLS
ncbi:MAG: threonylcarbamoyl-AMP synthase [Clostridiales bacterium]|nr:threonylcarbamoyl-AMP synthase [Clostridiales bacterium]